MDITAQHKDQFVKTIEHLKTEIATLRTGRATPALVEDIIIEAYGTKQALKSVATITVADAKTLNIDPWDKSLTQAVENGLRNSPLGISPVNDGKVIRLPLPDLTADRRQELIKVLHGKLEAARIALRKIREEVRDQIDDALKSKLVGEDDKYKMQEDLEKLMKDYNEMIKQIGEAKEKEITTI